MYQLVKTEEIVTTVTFRGRKLPKTEIKYTYESNDGAKLTFMADNKKAWSWKVFNDQSNDIGLKNMNKIIDFHISK